LLSKIKANNSITLGKFYPSFPNNELGLMITKSANISCYKNPSFLSYLIGNYYNQYYNELISILSEWYLIILPKAAIALSLA